MRNLSIAAPDRGLSVAGEAGYESASPFSREYSRFFGQPPMRDIKALRDGKAIAINGA